MTDAGEMVQAIWQELPQRWSHLTLDAFVVMPNHFHGLLWIEEERIGLVDRDGVVPERATTKVAPTLGQIVGAWKSLTTHRYVQGVHGQGWRPFAGRLWQRNYYDHIVRNDEALWTIQQYIENNPLQWELDPLHPEHPSKW